MAKIQLSNNNHFKKKQNNDKKFNSSYETSKCQIKLPKNIFSVIEILELITSKKRNELLNEFIIDELESYSYDLDLLIRFILNRGDVLERLRVGINEFYGEEIHKKKSGKNSNKVNYEEFEEIEIMVQLSSDLITFIGEFCRVSKVKREELFAFMIIARLEFIYSDPENIFSYIESEHGLFEILKEGINTYYGKEIINNENI